MRNLTWGEIADLKYGKSLREYPETASEECRFRVFGTNGPIGWHSTPLVDQPGIVIGRKGAYRGVHFSSLPFFVIDTAYYLHIHDPQIDTRWAFYQLLTVDINRMDSGSAIPSTKREDFYAVPVSIPALSIQNRIADILTAYDDLMENNRRRMILLEESVRLLYREWFVRFRYPGHENVHVSNGLPPGWRKVTLGGICSKIGSGFTPRGGSAAYLTEGITLIRSMNVYDDRFEDDGLAFIDDKQAADLDNVTIQSRDILLNITGASVARCCMAPDRYLPARVNQHVMIIRADPAKADPFLVHAAINSDERKRQLLSYARKGSTREALTKETMSAFEIVLPTIALMRRFGEIAERNFRQRETLALQNQKLRTARDLLLPRLMSGEIAV